MFPSDSLLQRAVELQLTRDRTHLGPRQGLEGLELQFGHLQLDARLGHAPGKLLEGREPAGVQDGDGLHLEDQCLVLTRSAEKAPSSHDVIRLDKALQHAISLGCRTSIDRMTYALLADSLGGSFEHHPLMVDTFRQIAQEQASLSALAEAIPQDTWDRIKIDLSQPHQESVR